MLTRRETTSPLQALLQVWARVEEGKRVGDLLAERCSPAVLDFLRSTHVGRTAPPAEGTGIGGGSRGSRGCRRRSKRSSDPRAPGIGFHWCGIGFLPFVISLALVRYISSCH